ncbi:MAG: transcriptional regulator [Thermoplasmata archaeon]
MDRTRDRMIERVRVLLEHAGFYLTDTHNIRPTSFDLMARRDSLLLLIKVLKNVDALDADESARLTTLGTLFPARPIVIGETSGAAPLEAGVVYNRYGVPVIAEESLRDYLEEGLPPFLLSSPGGVFARIDGDRLRRLREARQLSLGAVASVAGVSRRTIQLYETGAGAEVTIVERIEKYLGEPIVRSIDLFDEARRSPPPADPEPEPTEAESKSPRNVRARREKAPASTGDPVRDGVFRSLDGMGWDVVVTIRCPFDALTRGTRRSVDELLLTGVGHLRNAAHRAEILQRLARVAEAHALFVVRESPGKTSVEGLPIVTVHELELHRDPKELLDLLAERENA